jgi:hypothetical protein
MTDTPYIIPEDEQFIIEAASNEDAIEMAQLLMDCIDGAVDVVEAHEQWEKAQDNIIKIAEEMYRVAEVEEV